VTDPRGGVRGNRRRARREPPGERAEDGGDGARSRDPLGLDARPGPAGVPPPGRPPRAPGRITAAYRYEAQAWRAGAAVVAGLDEVGRGPLAGPVVAAAVVIAPDRRIRHLADSKLLAPERRQALFGVIQERAVAVGVGIVDHLTIDRINILEATRLAMREALDGLAVVPQLVITDFVVLPRLPCPQRNLVDGDARCASVAAASIVAKVTRDRLMLEADREYPEYGFARHKGYATAEHLAAMDRHGPCPLHRRTFAGVWRQGELFVMEDEE
jgi:ribonuclease HII